MPRKDWTGPDWKWPKTWRWFWRCELDENVEESSDFQNSWNWGKWNGKRCCGRRMKNCD